MTCIIGLKDESGIYMGQDSYWGNGIRTFIGNSKITKIGKYTIGCAGSYKELQALQYRLDTKIMAKYDDNPEREAFELSRSIASILREEKLVNNTDNVTRVECDLLIAWKPNNLFVMWEDFTIHKIMEYQSIGCAELAAHAALYILKDYKISPKEKIKKGLEVAAHYISGVAPPFNIIKV